MPIAGNRSVFGGGAGARGLKFDPAKYVSYNDTGIDTDEALDNAETGIDCDADATTAIPVGSIIRIDTEFMSVTATGTTLTVVRPNPVAHNTNADIYKKVNNTVLWLPGQDDAQSSTIRDRSGNGNNGSITGATWVRLPSGLWVLSFDGTDDTCDCGTGASLVAAFTSLTLEAWIKHDATPAGDNQYGYIITRNTYASDTNGDYLLDLSGGTNLRLLVRDAGAWSINLTSATAVTRNVWTHVAAVWDGTTAYLYINGVVDANTAPFVSPIVARAIATRVCSAIGAPDVAWRYKGQVALPRISTSASQVVSHYNQERHLFGV